MRHTAANSRGTQCCIGRNALPPFGDSDLYRTLLSRRPLQSELSIRASHRLRPSRSVAASLSCSVRLPRPLSLSPLPIFRRVCALSRSRDRLRHDAPVAGRRINGQWPTSQCCSRSFFSSALILAFLAPQRTTHSTAYATFKSCYDLSMRVFNVSFHQSQLHSKSLSYGARKFELLLGGAVCKPRLSAMSTN